MSFTALPAATLAALVLIPLAGKFAGAFLSTYLTRLDAPFTLATGLMSKGVAEIALLLVLLETGVIEKSVFSLFVLIMFGYILLLPPVIDFTIKRAKSPRPRHAGAGGDAGLRPLRPRRREGKQRAGPDAGLSRIGHVRAKLHGRLDGA